MSLIDELKASGALISYWDFRRGSLLDFSGNGQTIATISNANWANTKQGFGLNFKTAGSYVKPTAFAQYDLSEACYFAVAIRINSPASFPVFLAREGNYSLAFNSGAEPKTFGLYSWGGGYGWQASTFTPTDWGNPHFYATNFKNNVINGSSFYVDGIARGTATVVVTRTDQPLTISRATPTQELGGIVLIAGVVNRNLTAAEHHRLYNEHLLEAHYAKMTHSNFKTPYPALSPADYITRSTFLDLSMKSSGNKLLNYAPTTYAPVIGIRQDETYEGVFEVAQRFGPGIAGLSADCGDVTQYNGATSCTTSMWFKLPSLGVLNARCLFGKHDYIATGHRFICQVMTASPGPHAISYYEQFTGGNATATTPSCIYPNIWHHLAIVRNGSGSTDADKIKIYIDGQNQTLTFPGPNNFPTTLSASLSGRSFVLANTAPAAGTTSQSCKIASLRCESRQWTAAEVLAEYNIGAKIPIYSNDFTDCPVSLSAIGSGLIPNTEFQIVSGTWSITEDSTTRQKFLNCVTAGTVAIPLQQVIGSWSFDLSKSATTAPAVLFNASIQNTYSTTGQNTYAMLIDANENLQIFKSISGATTTLFNTSNAYIVANTTYRYWFKRDYAGIMTLYIKGGAFGNTWTTVSTAGGSGTNPITDTAHFTGSYMVLQFGVGDKIGNIQILNNALTAF